MTHTITLCTSCPGALTSLAETLRTHLPAFTITTTDCMSGCTRPATIAFRASGKTAYLFGDLGLDELPNLLTFATAYLSSPDGTFKDARPLGSLRTKAIARIPANP